MSIITDKLGIESDAGKKDLPALKDKNMDNNEKTLKEKVVTGLWIGGGVLFLSATGYVLVRSIGYQTARRKVEERAKEYPTSEYAIAMATAFKQFGGISEYLYDTISDYLPGGLTPKDSDFTQVKKVANQLNSWAIKSPAGFDVTMKYFQEEFKKYTRKDFDSVAKKVLDDGQYQELLGILSNKDKSTIPANTYADVQDNSLIFNTENVVTHGKSVGEAPWTQNDLKNVVIMTAKDISTRNGIIFQFDGKYLDYSKNRVTVQNSYRIDKNDAYGSCAAGAVLGVLTGRVCRPSIAYSPWIENFFEEYYVEFIHAGDGKKYWAFELNLAFVKGKQNAILNIGVTAKSQEVKTMSLFLLDKCKSLDGSALKGIEETSVPTRTRAQITALNGVFPVYYGGRISRYHAFIEGEIVGEMGDDILVGYDKGNVAIPKNLVSIKILS